MAENDIEAKVAAVERLVKVFAFERVAYAFMTLVGLLLAIYATYHALEQRGFSAGSVTMLLSSGIMGYSTTGIIKMFSECLAVVAGTSK